MNPGDQLRYGWIGGGKYAVPVQMLASQAVVAPGGRFVEMVTGSGYATYLDDGDDDAIFGSSEGPYGTQSSTQSATDVVNCIVDITAIYKIPILSGDGTFAITDIGDTCDIGVTSSVQGAHLQASNDEHFIVLGGDLVNNNWAIVRLNPNVQGETGSA